MNKLSSSSYFEILVEGTSDVSLIEAVMTRKFGLAVGKHFRVHPHQGRGHLPKNLQEMQNKKDKSLLNQLPAKLKGFSHLSDSHCLIVLIDVDRDNSDELIKSLDDMLLKITKRPKHVLFRLAIEEMESWLIADTSAIAEAYPNAKIGQLKKYQPDQICGAWEKLAQALGKTDLGSITGKHKEEWVRKISPYLDLDNPPSPSFRKFIDSIQQYV